MGAGEEGQGWGVAGSERRGMAQGGDGLAPGLESEQTLASLVGEELA
jgi:hypothetical protein